MWAGEYVRKKGKAHIVLTPTRVINNYRSLCDRNVPGPSVTELPEGWVLCKQCAKKRAKGEGLTL